MVHMYAACGEWIFNGGWSFACHAAMGRRLCVVEWGTTCKELNTILSEDFGVDERHFTTVCSYLPEELMKLGSPPVYITTDRQVKHFVTYFANPSIELCVTFKPRVATSSGKEENPEVDVHKEPENVAPFDCNLAKEEKPEVGVDEDDDDPVLVFESTEEENVRWDQLALDNVVWKGQRFDNKELLKFTMEMCAAKHNFDYKVMKSDTEWFYIRCSNGLCDWRLRARSVSGFGVYRITKCVSVHTCAPSSQKNAGKIPSAKSIARLIMPKYRGRKSGVGPSPIDIMDYMRVEQGVEISYSLAYDAREYAVNAVRGIPEKSYAKIPKYLYMLEAANPGTHHCLETEADGRFKYLFLAFGQSIRGYHSYMHKLIVVDGTFLKNKYKGVLLVATALDGNNNLYPLAFGVLDSENDDSWTWFMRELIVVFPDDPELAFVSDRSSSIRKAIETVYPEAKHGICIHHLMNNVVTNHHGRSLLGLIGDASKFCRPVEFVEKLDEIYKASPKIGQYLSEADPTKWARCQFTGFRYDVRTNNPAESVNSALRAPREYLLIPLLDNIRAMLTRWFTRRRAKSLKRKHPLTLKVEKKIARRIGKSEKYTVEMVHENHVFHVIGDKIDCVVNLEKKTCSCKKYDTLLIPCKHAIRAALSIGKDGHSVSDVKFTTVTQRAAYEESVNPISIPEDEWVVPEELESAHVYPPETKMQAGRKRKSRYKSVEDKIRKSQVHKKQKTYKCSRCHHGGHNKSTCKMPI